MCVTMHGGTAGNTTTQGFASLEVRVGNTTITTSPDATGNPLCRQISGSGVSALPNTTTTTISCGSSSSSSASAGTGMVGRYVSIQIESATRPLTLCEVQVGLTCGQVADWDTVVLQ